MEKEREKLNAGREKRERSGFNGREKVFGRSTENVQVS